MDGSKLKLFIKIIKKVGQFLLYIFLIFIALNFRSPIVFKLRTILPFIVIVLCLFILLFEIKKLVRKEQSKIQGLFLIFLICLPISIVGFKQYDFYSKKHFVLSTSTEVLEKYGKHFVVGYHDYNEVKNLVEKKAIGGIFITSYNIKDKTSDDVKKEINTLQDIRKKQGLTPLFISTDQEGGIVSRLSPLIPDQPSLASVIENIYNKEARNKKVAEYAKIQSYALRDLGINLNFAPVVDINYGTKVNNDQYSKITERAIASDPNLVAEVAQVYSETLIKNNVFSTIKHFPGLGRIDKDTHFFRANIELDKIELEQTDWVPFREVSKNTDTFIMVGHVGVNTIDRENPASFSEKVIGVIRNEWKSDNILITDDFSMGPVYYSNGGVSKATIKSLNSGMDLILISYDSDLYYEAMHALIKNDKHIDQIKLDLSSKRLEKALSRLEIK